MSGAKGRSGGHNRLSDRDRAINGDKHKARYGEPAADAPPLLPGVVDHKEIGKLGPAGRKMFNILFPMLDRLKVISQTDSFAFYLLCDSFDRFEAAKKLATGKAIVISDIVKDGKPVVVRRKELLDDWDNAKRQLLSQFKDFGIDPEARKRIIETASGEDDEGIEI